jgi:DNA-binding NtrC family response regulator
MRETQASLLIVDDERSIRISLLCVFAELGYRVRAVEDGFSALVEISREEPEILLSDLNMPGMSGFALLAEVRRRFPAIRTIAMSGAFNGSEVPSGVAADAFYEKGSSVGALVRMLQNLPWHERVLARQAAGLSAAASFQASIQEGQARGSFAGGDVQRLNS